MSNISRFDPTRETVGKIYRDLSINGPKDMIECGDMTNELMSSLVCDLNDTIASDPYKGRDYYITVAEKKDMVMPRAIHRQIRTTLYRPYPEDDTLVFRLQSGEVKFCWCLPHWSEMDNMLTNPNLYENELLEEISAWKNNDLTNFGFQKVGYGEKWASNPNFIDKPLFHYKNMKSKLLHR